MNRIKKAKWTAGRRNIRMAKEILNSGEIGVKGLNNSSYLIIDSWYKCEKYYRRLVSQLIKNKCGINGQIP